MKPKMFVNSLLIFRKSTDVPEARVESAKPLLSEKKEVVAPKAKKSFLEMCDDVAWSLLKPEDDCFKFYEGGEFSGSEKRARTEVLAPGISVLRDVGLTFYKVVNGDTLDKIRMKLGKFPEFAYLKELSRVKILSFNIPPHLLQLGMWIPIPSNPETKEELSEEAFRKYCFDAIDELKKNPIYDKKMASLEAAVGRESIIAAMIAVAKTESGNKLGKFADRRYENGHKAFSYTLFHVLMAGAGLRARRNLGMTTGQALHPRNSAKLFLAFIFQKAGRAGVEKYFPLHLHFEDFATFYNGHWEGKEPSYPEELLKYYPAFENPMAKN